MPWAPADATRHDKQANTKAKRRKWSAIANAVLGKTGDDVLAIKTANARTEALDRSPLLFETSATQILPWQSVPDDLDTPHPKKNTTVARMPDWLKTKDSAKPSEEPTRIIKTSTARPRSSDEPTRISALSPKSRDNRRATGFKGDDYKGDMERRHDVGLKREKAAQFRRAVKDAEEFAKTMADQPAPPKAPLTRTPLKADVKKLPTPVEHVRGIMDKLAKDGKPIPASLQQLHDRVVANEKGLKRTPLSGA